MGKAPWQGAKYRLGAPRTRLWEGAWPRQQLGRQHYLRCQVRVKPNRSTTARLGRGSPVVAAEADRRGEERGGEVRGCGGGRAEPGPAELSCRGPAHGVRPQPRLLWDGKRRVLWDGEPFCGGEGRAATIMGWRGLPRPEGGRWVAGHIMGWRALVPPGGVLWDEEDAPQGGGGSGRLLWDGRARRSWREARVLWDGTIPSAV